MGVACQYRLTKDLSLPLYQFHFIKTFLVLIIMIKEKKKGSKRQ